jgi:folate-binding protein YgfZ
MVTNDVAALAPGAWVRAAMLNVKGRVLAVVEILAEAESLLVLTEPVTADKVFTILDRHAIADDVAFARESRPLHRIWATPAEVWTAPPVFAAAASVASAAEAEARRIEAGLPRYGVDVSEDQFPFEANLDSAISYSKGCYAGQEVVARASARGHANKRLVGLRLGGDERDGPVPAGAPVTAAVRPEAGVATSSAVSPTFGPIALAYLHKSVWEPGTQVSVAGRAAVATALPFSLG